MSEEIYHHGVKGMKWGVKRTQTQLGHSAQQKTKSQSSLFRFGVKKPTTTRVNTKSAKSNVSKSKSIKDMSDDELNKAIKRLELEKRYKDLSPKTTPKGQSVVKKMAKKTVDDILVPASMDVGKQIVKSQMAKTANRIFEWDDTEYKIYSNNQKKK